MILYRLLFIIATLGCLACHPDNSSAKSTSQGSPADSTKKHVNYNLKAKKVIDSLKLDKRKIYIQIDKSKYTLSLKIGETVIKSYPVVLGFNPVDDKMKEGDGCTPEGTFKIKSQYPHKSWNKFIWIDYPNAESWKKFKQRKKDGTIPKNAKIGGEIGIHGVPKGTDMFIDMGKNWTLGCISLKNADVSEIYSLVKAGTKIVINH
jgi:murein L,D-transpeptidase YafK